MHATYTDWLHGGRSLAEPWGRVIEARDMGDADVSARVVIVVDLRVRVDVRGGENVVGNMFSMASATSTQPPTPKMSLRYCDTIPLDRDTYIGHGGCIAQQLDGAAAVRQDVLEMDPAQMPRGVRRIVHPLLVLRSKTRSASNAVV